MPTRKSYSKKSSSRKSHSSMSGQIGYCVKCKAKRTMVSCKNATSKNGRNMIKGVCKKCGTKMNVFTK